MLIYSEKATKFFEIFPLLLSYVVLIKSKVKISQNFVAFFSEYMNFNPKKSELTSFISKSATIGLTFHDWLKFEYSEKATKNFKKSSTQ